MTPPTGDLSGLCPEAALLVLAARPGLSPDATAQAAALLARLPDTDGLMSLAGRHGMQPLLFRLLRALPADRVPPPLQERLRHSCRLTAARSLLMTDELLRLSGALEQAGLRVLAFKGPALAALAYGDPTLRTFSDLDLLVPREQVPAAKAALLRAGYAPEPLTPRQEASLLRNGCEMAFRRQAGGMLVELHWRFTDRYFPFPLVTKELWERARRIPLAGGHVLTLSPEDTLLAVCVHATKHGWFRMEWAASLAALLAALPAPDAGRMREQARALRVERAVRLSLCVTADLLAVPLPEPLAAWARADARIAALARRVAGWLAAPPAASSPAAPPPAEEDELCGLRFQWRTRDRLRDRLAIVLRRTLKPTAQDRAALRLPAPLAPLYYLARPLRLLAARVARRDA